MNQSTGDKGQAALPPALVGLLLLLAVILAVTFILAATAVQTP